MCEVGIVMLIVIVGIIICVQMAMVFSWSRETELIKSRIAALETRKPKADVRRPMTTIHGKLHVTMDGKSRTLDAEFVPETTAIARRPDRTGSQTVQKKGRW